LLNNSKDKYSAIVKYPTAKSAVDNLYESLKYTNGSSVRDVISRIAYRMGETAIDPAVKRNRAANIPNIPNEILPYHMLTPYHSR
jgi:hypothetical protein